MRYVTYGVLSKLYHGHCKDSLSSALSALIKAAVPQKGNFRVRPEIGWLYLHIQGNQQQVDILKTMTGIKKKKITMCDTITNPGGSKVPARLLSNHVRLRGLSRR
jgi:hypothetical protein